MLLGALTACANDSADGAPAGSGAGGGREGGRGRGTPTAVLSASDVHVLARGIVETTTPLTGDLRPIEEILVRARVEGDVTTVRVREGDAVRVSDVLAVFDAAELEAAAAAADADAAAARGDSATAQWNLTQSQELFRAGAIAEQALRAAEQGALAARARLAAAEARRRTAQVALRDARVVAPASGTIAARLVQTGERVSRGAHLFTLVRDDTLEFTAAIPARAAASVRVGQSVRFAADGRQLTGSIARISPSVDPASRSVAVFVRVPNEAHALKANTFASGRVVSDTRRDVLSLPLTAVRRSREDDAPFVYRIAGDAIEVVPVALGATDESLGVVELLSGLAEGDRVIVGNVGTIGRGMRVQILDGDRSDDPAGPAGRAGGASRGRGSQP